MAVGEEQHYGRAARRLRVAQPALSRQIQDLEEEVGFKLFERLPRAVKLSLAGIVRSPLPLAPLARSHCGGPRSSDQEWASCVSVRRR